MKSFKLSRFLIGMFGIFVMQIGRALPDTPIYPLALLVFYGFIVFARNNYWWYFVCEGLIAIVLVFAFVVTVRPLNDYLLFGGLGFAGIYVLLVMVMDRNGYPVLKPKHDDNIE